MAPDSSQPELRASDADREAAADRLRVAAQEGRLDAVELDERMSSAYAARWCSELSALTADVTPSAAAPAVPAAPVFERRGAGTNGFAIAAFVCGLIWMWWLGSILAVVFGHIALKQTSDPAGGQGGRGLAIAGTVLGYIGIATLVLGVIALLAGA